MTKLKISLCVIFALCFSQAAMGAVYKCVRDGKLLFSDRPCAGSNAEENIHIRGTSGAQEENTESGRTSPETEPDNQYCSEKEIHKLRIEYLLKTNEVAAQKSKITTLLAAQESEIAALRDKKRYSRNNMAGATWEQSISQEMDAIAASYRNKMSYHNAALDRLDDEHRILKDRLTECIGEVPF